ncbi:hypothetical protein Catovirus_1_1077 [Catovirus CTV1]|uniref:Uncharacterized protein n=1 Tax=Catovirus CTV1 TaxID=1977631 RepID=A0A1V0SBC9_9VIRU|nr:hypothetical protein Catovirus_1_1077 [Catovirus CTV1]
MSQYNNVNETEQQSINNVFGCQKEPLYLID